MANNRFEDGPSKKGKPKNIESHPDEGATEVVVEQPIANRSKEPISYTSGETSGNGIKVNGKFIEFKNGPSQEELQAIAKLAEKIAAGKIRFNKEEKQLQANYGQVLEKILVAKKNTEEQVEETESNISDKDGKKWEESWKNKFKGEEKPAAKNKAEKLSREDMDFLRHQVNFWDERRVVAKLPKFEDILQKSGISKEKIIKMKVGELIEETRKITGQKENSQSQKETGKEKDLQKTESKKEYDAARAEYVRRLLSAEEYDEGQINRMANSPEGKKMIKDIIERRKKEAEKEYPKPDLESGEKAKIESIKSQIQEAETRINQEKPKTKFEEYEEKLSEVSGGKFNYEISRNWYLATLGCEVKYNFWHSKAWLVEKKTGNFIGENGEVIEKNDKKTKRAEFATGWNFPAETPTLFIEFLRETVEKKLNGANNLG